MLHVGLSHQFRHIVELLGLVILPYFDGQVVENYTHIFSRYFAVVVEVKDLKDQSDLNVCILTECAHHNLSKALDVNGAGIASCNSPETLANQSG